MRTVLLIARWFPPAGGIQAVRWSKLLKYLPRHGWRARVLTATLDSSGSTDRIDPTFACDNVEIVRAPHLRPERFLAGNPAVRALRRIPGTAHRGGAPPAASVAGVLRSFAFPDPDIGWFPGGVRAGRRMTDEERPAVVLSTSPPVSAHLLGRHLAKRSRIPWVLEMRDPWADNPVIASPVHRRAHQLLERWAVSAAQRVVCVVPEDVERLCSKYPALRGRCDLLTNGFDPEDYSPALRPSSDRFIIRHVGSMYRGQQPRSLLEGLALAVERSPSLRDEVVVEFVGAVSPVIAEWIDAFVGERRLFGMVRLRSFVPHSEAIELMQTANLLFLLLGAEFAWYCYPGKLFEYLGTGRPILANSEVGPAATLIRELSAGRAVPNDPAAIAAALLDSIAEWRAGGDSGRAAAPGQFAHPVLAQTLARILDAAADGSEAA